MRLRVYADRSHYSAQFRRSANDIVKAAWSPMSNEERIAAHGNRATLFEVVADPEAAQLHLLTMNWSHYIEHDLVAKAERAVGAARRARKPIAVFCNRDSEANFPIPGTDIHVFQASGYRSRTRTRNHGLPPFFGDPLGVFCEGNVAQRDKGPIPIVGFCGQAGASLARHAVRYLRTQARIVQWRLGHMRWEPAPLEHTWFRQRILDAFQRSREVQARFVLRAQYRAGLAGADDRTGAAARSRREFVNNILDTDYTVCVRGGGNFSVRFYEALALGRIPVFIDTDCVLPYHDRIDWKRYAVWVDEQDADDAPRRVSEFHARLSPQEFRERQLECRRLWRDWLSPEGFYARFHEYFSDLS